MKKFLLLICLFGIQQLRAQKYILLDQRISMPVKYSNTITKEIYKSFTQTIY